MAMQFVAAQMMSTLWNGPSGNQLLKTATVSNGPTVIHYRFKETMELQVNQSRGSSAGTSPCNKTFWPELSAFLSQEPGSK